MKDIGGRVAVVTGASRGLGRAIAQTLFDHGMKVVVSARHGEELEDFRNQLDRSGTRTLAVPADVTLAADRVGLVAAARRKFGEVDVLVNNAGTDHPEFFAEADFGRAEKMVELNLVALMGMTQVVLPGMLARRSGQIVNIASMAGLAPVPYASVYAATKAAVINFSQSLRYEVADAGVGVSVVCPYYVRDAGLFHENSGGDSQIPTVSPEDVGASVVSAITRNRARVLSTPAIVKLTPMLTGLSPGLTYFAAKTSGAVQAMERMADNLRQRDAARAPLPTDRATDLVATEPVVVDNPPTPKKAAPRRARADKAG
jgi:short-subunit dehydrogenase